MTVCGMALHIFAFGRIICHLRLSDKRIDMAATLFYLTPKSPTAFDKLDLSHKLFALACKVCVGKYCDEDRDISLFNVFDVFKPSFD